MAHSDQLTENEYQAILNKGLNSEIIRYLHLCMEELGLSQSEIRIIDWGCGRGVWVARLLELGFTNVKGADISKGTIELGRSFFESKGHNIDNHLSQLHSDGSSEFPDDYAHFVFSTQVFEHIEDMDLAVKELDRITAPGGMGMHIFPSHYRPIEGHLYMPVVHWLPKGSLRKKLIQIWTFLGIEPKWKQLDGHTWQEKADTYYQFTVKSTYYRPYKKITAFFSKRNIKTRLVSIDHPAFNRKGSGLALINKGIFKPIINWLVLNFKTVELLTIKGK